MKKKTTARRPADKVAKKVGGAAGNAMKAAKKNRTSKANRLKGIVGAARSARGK